MSTDQTDIEIAICEEAIRLIQSNAVPKDGWHEWNVFSGRMEYQEESNSQWVKRILRMAQETIRNKLQSQNQ